MAKIIENVYETILQEGKKILLNEGYNKMTLRLVASKANIATGTIYNYFSSKDVLVSKIMWGDWMILNNELVEELKEVNDVISGIEKIFMMLKKYTDIYKLAWDDYGGSLSLQSDRHKILINQLSSYIDELLKRFDVSTINNLSRFISEIVLNAGSRGDVYFDDIKPFISKLLD